MIEDGTFREDLYFRLAVVKIEVPSLAQRRDDILLIAKHFLVEFNQKFGKSFYGISPEAAAALKIHDWKGNVRELKNIMERAVLMSEGKELTADHLGLTAQSNDDGEESKNTPPLPRLSEHGVDFPSLMASFEKRYFEDALEMANGNESKAAKLLGLTRDKFRYRRRKLIDA